MAPPPPANLPLAERLKALAQTLQYVPISASLALHERALVPEDINANHSYHNRFAWFVGYVKSTETFDARFPQTSQ